MSHFDDQPPAADPAAPVFRPGEFKGREGLAGNLLRRLARGESLSIVGGPKLGKTSLLRHLAWRLNHAVPSESTIGPSAGPSAVYVDLADQAACEQIRSCSQESRTTLLLDNCDQLIEGKTLSLSEIGYFRGGPLVFAGARAWREGVKDWERADTLKAIPLSVFLKKDAEELFRPDVSPEQKAWILAHAGTHPFMVKFCQEAVLHEGDDVRPDYIILENVKTSLIPFFHHCIAQLREPLEYQVLTSVIEAEKPVNPREVARAVGLPTIKPIADLLCSMGLIARWIRGEEATLSANSRLFTEWYRATVMH